MIAVPSSIQRLEPFPSFAVELLERIGSGGIDSLELPTLAAEKPEFWEALMRVAVKSAGKEAGAPQIPAARLAEIAITLVVREYLRRAFLVADDYRYWRYSLACAVCSEQVALPRGENTLLAYAAGLLHDIGRLALIAAYPMQYSNLMTLTDRHFASGEQFDVLEYEKLLFGLDHFDTGAWVGQAWQLPAWLRSIAGKFKEKPKGDHAVLMDTIRAGTRLAHSLGFGYLAAAPRVEVRAILSAFPDADKHWKVLDSWEYAEETLRGKVRARLEWYSEDEPAPE